MFYSQFILAKKGPLGTIWIAAHLERKLRKNQVADTDIGVSVDSIIFPDVPIALRLSSHLLLGVVRIYSRKVNYLFDDCSETLLKIKQAFRSAAVDLPPEESKAPYHSITLPETFDLDDFELPDTDIFQGNYVDHHVSAKEQITLQDTMEGVVFSTSQFGLDERFGDEETCQIGLDLNEDAIFEKNEARANDEDFNSDPQSSVHPMTPLDADEDNTEMTESSKLLSEHDGGLQEMEVLERNSEPTDFAEAPSTPMLVEEANLSSVQDALASDEHVESEVPNLAEPFQEEDGRHISRADIVDSPLSGEMTIQQDRVQPAQDCIAYVSSVNGPNSVHLPSLDHDDHEKPMSLESRPADYLMKNLGGADDSNADVLNEETTSCIGSQTAAISEEVLAAKSDGALEQEKCDPEEVAETVENLLLPEKAPAVCQLDSLDSPGLDSSKVDMPKDLPEDQERDRQSNFGLQACSSKVRHQEETSFAEVEKDCAAVDVIELDCHGNQMSEVLLHGQETDSGERSQQWNDTAPNDQPKDKCSMNLDLAAPEILLSVPTEIADKPNILLPDSTPYKEYFQEEMTSNLTESAVPLLSNPLESSELFQSKQTTRSIPNDDDLLSSILVGRRSSVLKMNPSPVPLALTPAKRVRNASRASTSKRKVLMDESMVLHGDVIRLQLINTDDLRRARKKAPCTLSEISTLRRQYLEDEIFSESTHPGLSRELSYMQKGVYDLSRLKISEFIEPISPTAAKIRDEPNLSKETNKEENEDPMSIGDGDEVRAVETPLIENHQDSSLASGSHTVQFEVESLQFECNDRIDAMEIDGETVARVEPVNNSAVSSFDGLVPVDPVLNDLGCLSVNIDSNTADKEGDAVDEVHTSPDITLKTECFEKTPSAVELITEKGLNALAEPCDVTQSEHPSADYHLLNGLNNGGLDEIKTDSPTDHCLMASHDVEVSAVTALVGEDGCSNMILEESGEAVDTIGISSFGAVHEVESHNPLSVNVVDEAGVTGNCSEPTADFVHQLEHEADVGCASLPIEEIADVHDSRRSEDLQTTNDLDDLENVMYGNDTEFLNVDDDEVDDDNEHVADGQESLLLDNSGWSSRTRAVAKYLQMLFDKEEEGVRGRSVIGVDSLLAGKTRKEASRMFFESLVLKTKDYIQVEQEKPFDNIKLRPRVKLMKSIF